MIGLDIKDLNGFAFEKRLTSGNLRAWWERIFALNAVIISGLSP